MTISLDPAPTSWASAANFASGPNIGTPTKVDPGAGTFAQGFVPGNTLPAQHFNFLLSEVTEYLEHLADELIVAIDGTNGGSYTLASTLTFAGQDVRFSSDVQLLSGSDLEVLSGASIALFNGSSMTVATGAGVQMGDSEDLTINNSTDVFRLTLGSAVVLLSGGAATWKPISAGCGWMQVDVAGSLDVSFPLPLPVGDTITNITVVLTGGVGAGHVALPAGANRICVDLVAVSTAGAATVLARLFDQSGNVATYDASHTIHLASGGLDLGSLPQLVDDDFVYWVVVRGESGVNAIADTTAVTAVLGDVVARSYRSALMTY